MKPLATLISLFAFGLGIFGYWGVFTRSGRRQYDEMAVFIPVIALLIAAIIFVLAIVIFILHYFKNKKRK
jgi:hypothetical protein